VILFVLLAVYTEFLLAAALNVLRCADDSD